MEINRRKALAATAASLIAAGAVALPSEADQGKNDDDTVYGHAMVWNSELPGDAGKLRLVFDIWANIQSGTGTGTAEDAVHEGWRMHFSFTSARVTKIPNGQLRFELAGIVTESSDGQKVGMPITMVADTARITRPSVITLGDLQFGIAGVIIFRGTRFEIK
jgi:hypothetical protein